eukprot:UN13738
MKNLIFLGIAFYSGTMILKSENVTKQYKTVASSICGFVYDSTNFVFRLNNNERSPEKPNRNNERIITPIKNNLTKNKKHEL